MRMIKAWKKRFVKLSEKNLRKQDKRGITIAANATRLRRALEARRYVPNLVSIVKARHELQNSR
jgi:hypothetical protein